MIARRGAAAVAVITIVVVQSAFASSAVAQPNVTISGPNGGAPSLEFSNELPGGASQIQLTVTNGGPGVVQLTVAGQDLSVTGGCVACGGATSDAADLLVMSLDLGSAVASDRHWSGTPRELATTTAELGTIPGGSSSTLTITETLPSTANGSVSGSRMSMALSFVLVDPADGTTTKVVIPDEVLGTTIERSVGAGGLALTGADIARVVAVGVGMIAIGAGLLTVRRRLQGVRG